MEVLRHRENLEQYISSQKKRNKTIGFAPTMGALHEGHLALYEEARKENDVVVSSIFVNPTQFNNAEDLEKYPRNIDRDIALLEKSGNVDAVYIPQIEDIYPNGAQRQTYDFGGIENVMEGKSRPGHFDGVGTVVEELFRQVQPNKAYFGEKDFQQLAIIRKLVELKNIPVQIRGIEIVRNADGLALSSRNERLTESQRKEAKIIYETLVKVNEWYQEGNMSLPTIKEKAVSIFNHLPGYQLEYFTVATENDLKEIEFFDKKEDNYRAFIVVHVGVVRLIDNVHLG